MLLWNTLHSLDFFFCCFLLCVHVPVYWCLLGVVAVFWFVLLEADGLVSGTGIRNWHTACA